MKRLCTGVVLAVANLPAENKLPQGPGNNPPSILKNLSSHKRKENTIGRTHVPNDELARCESIMKINQAIKEGTSQKETWISKTTGFTHSTLVEQEGEPTPQTTRRS